MKTELLFGVHCHQPVDNFDKVVYEIIEKSYKPFFTTLKQFPEFKCSVHFSGWLLEFIKTNDEELFTLLKSLTKQLEFFTGGFYEPILASIPSSNRIEQINMLSDYIEENFEQRPRGLWLTERIWDDSIIDDLKKCNIDYVMVDDYHLIASGFDKSNLKGYFLTENSNDKIALFPINKDLRYMIPFSSIDNTMNKLNSFSNEKGKNAAIIFDDGEKFGVWPKTHERVYEKQWLEKFFKSCIEDENINISTFCEFYDNNKAISLSYLPTVSYHEMGEWSVLPNISDDYYDLLSRNMHQEYLIRGGIWKNFFLKYNESNWIHKRVLQLSKEEDKTEEFKDLLFKAQCNDVLWHGVFGGIYLPNLRDNAYRYIIQCENLLNKENSCTQYDINIDSINEYKYYTKDLIIIIDPKLAGQIVELDLKEKLFNYQNTLTRYSEPYHKKIEKKDSLEEVEITTEDEIDNIHTNTLSTSEDIEFYKDWYLKKSAIDHICDNSLNLQKFKTCSFKEYADFANQEFEVLKQNNNSLSLKRIGGVYKEEKFETTLQKEFDFSKNKISSNIKINTKYNESLKYLLEWNLHFQDYDIVTINGHNVNEDLKLENSQLTIIDQSLNRTIFFQFDQCVDIYMYPVKSVSQSEIGVDYTIQGLCFGFSLEFKSMLDLKYSVSIK